MNTSYSSRKLRSNSSLRLERSCKTCADANNRPIRFTNQEGTVIIECGYDYMGRRFEKKVTVNGTITLHHRYLYRGYLQIVSLDAKRANMQDLWLIHWDPTQPTAIRPLSIRKNGTWYTYGHDLTKNVMEVFNTSGGIATTYDYTPFGEIAVQGSSEQPIQWSSEVYDEELALTYYNYRHYNPMDGRWINRDPIAEQGGYNLYGFVGNAPVRQVDGLGMISCAPMDPQFGYSPNNNDGWHPNNQDPVGFLVLKQVNINRECDCEMDLSDWLEKRMPNQLEKAIIAIKKSVDVRIQKLCFKKSNKIDPDELSKIRYRIQPEDIKETDKEYSFCENHFALGTFGVYIKDVTIKWNNQDCSYSWEGTAFAKENAGATDPSDPNHQFYDYVYYYTPYFFKGRNIVFANYEIKGTGTCKRK